MQIGEVINHQHRNRDGLDVIFKVIDNRYPIVICKFIVDLPYRVIYGEDNETIVAVDPSGGPMISVGDYMIYGKTLTRIWFSGNDTLMEFTA